MKQAQMTAVIVYGTLVLLLFGPAAMIASWFTKSDKLLYPFTIFGIGILSWMFARDRGVSQGDNNNAIRICGVINTVLMCLGIVGMIYLVIIAFFGAGIGGANPR